MFTVFVRKKSRGGYSQSKSTPLETKKDVRRWMRRSPMVKTNTKVTVSNILTNKSVTAPSWKFL